MDTTLKLGKNSPIIAAACDLNGIWRGKRIRFNSLEKVTKEGIRIPLSASCLDIWGSDLEDSPYLFESGDADGYGLPTGIGPIPFFSNKSTILAALLYPMEKWRCRKLVEIFFSFIINVNAFSYKGSTSSLSFS